MLLMRFTWEVSLIKKNHTMGQTGVFAENSLKWETLNT